MNIVIVSAYNIGNESGTAKVSERLSQSLSEEHQVLYICLGSKYQFQKVSKNLNHLKLPAVEVSGVYIPIITPKIKEKVFEQLTLFAPDVIHVQNIVFSGLISLFWAKENNVPFVVTFHYLPTEGLRYIFPKLKKDKVISTIDYIINTRYLEKYLKHVDLVIALNQKVHDSVRKIDKKIKIVNISNGLYLENFYRLKVHPPKKDVEFLYLGTYMARKNQEYLLQVFRHLPENYKLTLHGNLKTGHFYIKKLENAIHKNNIKNVQIKGFLSQDKVYKALENANYFVSASIKEVQSLVVIEALAAGLPIIALKNETTIDNVNKDNGLLISQKTVPEKFARKLKIYVETTTPLYSKVARNCRLSVKSFDINKVSEEILKSYKSAHIEHKKVKPAAINKVRLQLESLIPTQVKKLFVRKTNMIKPKRLNYLKTTLFLTFILSAVVGVISIFKSIKKNIVALLFNSTRSA